MSRKVFKKVIIALLASTILVASCKKNNGNDDNTTPDPKTMKILSSHKWVEIWQDMPYTMPDTFFIERDSFAGTQLQNFVYNLYEDGTYSRWFGAAPQTLSDSGTWWATNKTFYTEDIVRPLGKMSCSIVSLNDDSMITRESYQDTFLIALYLAR